MRTLPGRVRTRLAANAEYVKYYLRSRQAPDVFANVSTYSMFIGYPRSGHTLIGALLDAHPEIIIGNGADALKYVKMGFGRRELFYLLLEDSQNSASEGRKNNNYTYVVPDQWQGKFTTIRVIGDKRGGLSTRALALDPTLLDRLRQIIQANLKVIHIVRNPYDNIATICLRRTDQDLDASIEEYFALCAKVAGILPRLDEAEVVAMRHEAFVADPPGGLAEYCRRLGVQAPPEFLAACAATVFEAPRKTRHKIAWEPATIERIAERMAQYPFLSGYTFAE